MVNLATETPGHVSVKRAELDALIENSVSAAIQKSVSGKLTPSSADIAQEKIPDQPLLRAIHDWSLKP